MFSAVGEVFIQHDLSNPSPSTVQAMSSVSDTLLADDRYRGVLKRTWKDHLPIKVVNEFLAFNQTFVYVLFFPADIHCSQAISVRRKSHP